MRNRSFRVLPVLQMCPLTVLFAFWPNPDDFDDPVAAAGPSGGATPCASEMAASLRNSGGSNKYRDRIIVFCCCCSGPKDCQKLQRERRPGPSWTNIGVFGPNLADGGWPKLGHDSTKLGRHLGCCDVWAKWGQHRPHVDPNRPKLIELGPNRKFWSICSTTCGHRQRNAQHCSTKVKMQVSFRHRWWPKVGRCRPKHIRASFGRTWPQFGRCRAEFGRYTGPTYPICAACSGTRFRVKLSQHWSFSGLFCSPKQKTRRAATHALPKSRKTHRPDMGSPKRAQKQTTSTCKRIGRD